MKESSDPASHEFFACFLHSLFDEYRFFKDYPTLHLSLTGKLYGNLICSEVIDRFPLGIAVRYVLDALRKPPNTKYNYFGLIATKCFTVRLNEWLPLAEAILGIEHVVKNNPEIANPARAALARAREPEDKRVFRSIGYGPNDIEEIKDPSKEISELMRFIVNNLAPDNLTKKVEDTLAKLKEDDFLWFASFLIDRVKNQVNLQQLYLDYLQKLNKNEVMKLMMKVTFVEIAKLLEAPTLKSLTSSSESTSWLARPILKYSNFQILGLLRS
jgi:CCR4-NOT transcription complex subunit 1